MVGVEPEATTVEDAVVATEVESRDEEMMEEVSVETVLVLESVTALEVSVELTESVVEVDVTESTELVLMRVSDVVEDRVTLGVSLVLVVVSVLVAETVEVKSRLMLSTSVASTLLDTKTSSIKTTAEPPSVQVS